MVYCASSLPTAPITYECCRYWVDGKDGEYHYVIEYRGRWIRSAQTFQLCVQAAAAARQAIERKQSLTGGFR
ncbi:MAG: hypothetical protein WCA35_12195 [Kovacikia sp.]